MQRPKCSSRGRTMKKNGRTSGGKIRYRCAGCGASTSANPDNEGQGPVHRAGPAHVQGRTRDASSAGAYAATQVRADVEPDTARTQRRRRACRAAPRRHPSGSRRGRAHRRRRDLARGGTACRAQRDVRRMETPPAASGAARHGRVRRRRRTAQGTARDMARDARAAPPVPHLHEHHPTGRQASPLRAVQAAAESGDRTIEGARPGNGRRVGQEPAEMGGRMQHVHRRTPPQRRRARTRRT